MASKTIVLITGSRNGIGLALLKFYATQPSTTVIAAINYEPGSEACRNMLAAVPTVGKDSSILPVKYDAASPSSGRELAFALRNVQPEIQHIDIIIANAAINESAITADMDLDLLSTHFKINAIAPIALYQATRPFLLAAPAPKFFYISTIAASMEKGPSVPFPVVSIGMSKAAGNYFVVQANKEDEKVIFVAVHPGWVQSEQGDKMARSVGLERAPLTMESCVAGLTQMIEGATKDGISGTFRGIDGEPLPW